MRMPENGYLISDSNLVKKMRFVTKPFNFDSSTITGSMFPAMFEQDFNKLFAMMTLLDIALCSSL